MTTIGTSSPLDSIQTMQAAFAIGRAEYLRLAKWEAGGGMKRVMAAITNESGISSKLVIGGGETKRGKIRWLVENHPGISLNELAMATIETSLGNSRSCCTKHLVALTDSGEIKRERLVGRGCTYGYFKQEGVMK